MKTLKLTIKGKVQGVFFRANVQGKALELGVHGYARNLPTGEVEIVVQGIEEQIAKLYRFIRANPGDSTVESIETEKLKDYPEKFSSFEIR
ncbi:MAG TPA: acylphosphatase [Candidatus Nanoarchaeia archaeon]|nr:acylphosphatase [Candidatus Nanoarchaeia archaeon]